MLPPKQPLRSTSAVRAPARAAASAAARPPGPLPTTRTSVPRMTGISRAGSEIVFIAHRLAREAPGMDPGVAAAYLRCGSIPGLQGIRRMGIDRSRLAQRGVGLYFVCNVLLSV